MKLVYELDVNPVYKLAKSVKAKYLISSFQFQRSLNACDYL